jgi:SAM-dependent methyltransferase
VTAVDGVRADDRGIWFRAAVDDVVDVCFDGRRVWSFWLLRDSEQHGGERLAPWPAPLRRFLDGRTRLTVVAHVAGVTFYDEQVALGSGTERIAVVNDEGRPLGLDKSNRLSQTFDTRSPEQVAPLLDAIGEVLAALEEAGTQGFLAYGTLLGAVREGALIGHDSDADLGYLSPYSHPVDVIRESFALQRRVAELGFETYRYSGFAFRVDVAEADGSKRGLDVFGGFIAEPVGDKPAMLYLMGEIGAPFRREWIYPLTTATLEGRTFPVPADSERLLVATYGPSWRVPDPAYHFETARPTVRRLNGWFRGIRVLRSEWERKHSRTRRTPPQRTGTPLAAMVVEREGVPDQVVDLGAGRGRDALWFARNGAHVTALDFVPWASAAAQEAARDEDLDLAVRDLNLLSFRSWLGEGSRLAHTPGPRTVVARHLVDALTPPARDNAWRLCDMALRDGGRLYLEFRTGAAAPRAEGDLLAPVAVETVTAELAAHGAVIVHREDTLETRANGGDPGRPVSRLVAEWRR